MKNSVIWSDDLLRILMKDHIEILCTCKCTMYILAKYTLGENGLLL